MSRRTIGQLITYFTQNIKDNNKKQNTPEKLRVSLIDMATSLTDVFGDISFNDKSTAKTINNSTFVDVDGFDEPGVFNECTLHETLNNIKILVAGQYSVDYFVDFIDTEELFFNILINNSPVNLQCRSEKCAYRVGVLTLAVDDLVSIGVKSTAATSWTPSTSLLSIRRLVT